MAIRSPIDGSSKGRRVCRVCGGPVRSALGVCVRSARCKLVYQRERLWHGGAAHGPWGDRSAREKLRALQWAALCTPAVTYVQVFRYFEGVGLTPEARAAATFRVVAVLESEAFLSRARARVFATRVKLGSLAIARQPAPLRPTLRQFCALFLARADQLGGVVSLVSLCRWRGKYRRGGPDALAGRPRPARLTRGPKPKRTAFRGPRLCRRMERPRKTPGGGGGQ